jgi:hypothetical protein
MDVNEYPVVFILFKLSMSSCSAYGLWSWSVIAIGCGEIYLMKSVLHLLLAFAQYETYQPTISASRQCVTSSNLFFIGVHLMPQT